MALERAELTCEGPLVFRAPTALAFLGATRSDHLFLRRHEFRQSEAESRVAQDLRDFRETGLHVG
jgi:hypothetical protein